MSSPSWLCRMPRVYSRSSGTQAQLWDANISGRCPPPNALPQLHGHRHWLVNRRAPLRVTLVDAAHDVHVGGRQGLRDWADVAVAERELVDRGQRRDLVAAAAEEGLVCHVQLRTVDIAFDDLHAEEVRVDVLDQ